jgi:hypothetical protein
LTLEEHEAAEPLCEQDVEDDGGTPKDPEYSALVAT